MLLSKFMYFIHLHHICGINKETGVSQGSRSQSRQDTPSVTAAMSSFFFFLLLTLPVTPAGSCFSLVSSFFLLSFFILPAQPQDLVSYSFPLLSASFFLLSATFFLLSGNTSFSHTSLHPILTKLGHIDRYLDHYSGTDNDGVRGHDGVTGVKKVIFAKKASSPSEYLASMRDLCICISLTPSTKVMVLKIHQGSFGVTGVKSSFSPKRHQVLQNT